MPQGDTRRIKAHRTRRGPTQRTTQSGPASADTTTVQQNKRPEGTTPPGFFSSSSKTPLRVLCLGHLCPCQTVRAPRLRRCSGGHSRRSSPPVLPFSLPFLPSTFSPCPRGYLRLRSAAVIVSAPLPMICRSPSLPAWPVFVPISHLGPHFFLPVLPSVLILAPSRKSAPYRSKAPALHLPRRVKLYYLYIILFLYAASVGRRQTWTATGKATATGTGKGNGNGNGERETGKPLDRVRHKKSELATENRKQKIEFGNKKSDKCPRISETENQD